MRRAYIPALLTIMLAAGCPDDQPGADVGLDRGAADQATLDVSTGDTVDTGHDLPLPDKEVPDAPPAKCGDGVINGKDKCDGKQLGGKTCAALGYGGGTLSCTAKCAFDTSGCTWAHSVGGAVESTYCAIGVDTKGRVRFGGTFINSVTLGKTTLTGTPALSTHVFAAGLTPLGAYEWTFSGGHVANKWGAALAVSPAGESFVAGSFSSKTTFGGKTVTGGGMYDPYMFKLGSAGKVQWVKALSGGKYENDAQVVAVDAKGNAYLSGTFIQMLNFGKDYLTTTPYTNSAGYVATTNSAGKELWARKLVKAETVASVAADSQGPVLVGSYGLDRFSSAGKLQWSMDLSKLTATAKGVAVDGAGNACVTGYFVKSVTLGSTTLSSSGSKDIFVARLSPAGKVLWAKGFGGPSDDEGVAAATSVNGSCTVTGSFQWTATFGGKKITSAGGTDIFVARINAAGAVQWATSGGGTSLDRGYGVAVDSKGASFVQGWSEGAGTFGGAKLTNGTGSMVIWKVGANGK